MTGPGIYTSLQIARETTSSIELQRAKDGTYYWTAKVYFDGADSGALHDALESLNAADIALRATYLPKPPDLEAQLAESVAAAAKP